jgi:hypothetical protein
VRYVCRMVQCMRDEGIRRAWKHTRRIESTEESRGWWVKFMNGAVGGGGSTVG